MANQLGNSIENIVDQLDVSQPVRYEQSNFQEEIIHHKFDTFLDNSPNKLASMDVSPNVEISSQPLPTTINPAELSRGIYESRDIGQDTHVGDSILKDPQVAYVSPYDTKSKGGTKRRKVAKRR